MRTGSDIAFLGGVINYVINSEKWNKDPFFKTFVANYTNAATIISEDFKDTEDLEGGFSGLAPAKGGMPEWPFNALTNQYNGATEQYVREKAGAASPKLELKPGEGFAPLVESMVRPPVIKDPTLQHPRCVLQIVKRHFARYTPEMVEEATGCPKESFLKVAETILANPVRTRRLQKPQARPTPDATVTAITSAQLPARHV